MTLKQRIEDIVTQAICLLFMVLVGVHALYGASGCAHVKQVATACAVTASEVVDWDRLVTPDAWETGAKQFVDQYGMCVAQAAADQVLASALQLAMPLGEAPPLIAHTRAWRAEHP